LIGVADFSSSALDALEAYADAECSKCGGLRPLAHDCDHDDPHKIAAQALARYGQGEPAARVLVDLLKAILGAKPLADIERVRLSAQCEALRRRIEQQRAEYSKLAEWIEQNSQALVALEAEFSALAPMASKVPSAKG
jgi:hypothetical protein